MNCSYRQITAKAEARSPALALCLAAAGIAAVAAALFLFRSDFPGGGAKPGTSPREESGRSAGGIGQENTSAEEPSPAIPSAQRILLAPPAREGSAPVRVRGLVLDPEGAPMPAVAVAFQRLLPAEGDKMLEGAVKAGPEGAYAIELVPGIFSIAADAGSQRRGHNLWFEPQEVVVPEAEEFVHDILFIRPLCEIRGRVTRFDRTPIEGVGAALCTPRARILRKTITDGSGTFSFPGVAPGSYRMLFDKGPDARGLFFPWQRSPAPESSPDRWPAVLVEPGSREIAFGLIMAAPVRVTGTVLFRGMEPPAGGRLFLGEVPEDSGSPAPGRRRLYSAAVGEDGSFSLQDVFPGSYRACIYGPADGLARPDPVPVRIDPFPAE